MRYVMPHHRRVDRRQAGQQAIPVREPVAEAGVELLPGRIKPISQGRLMIERYIVPHRFRIWADSQPY